ncbi:hypothetical protein Tco_1192324 [Tanacetum coccineum]
MHESLYDTEFRIKVIKRYQPPQTADEDHIIFLGAVYDEMDQREAEPVDSDLHSMPDDEVQSISGFEPTDSNEEVDNLESSLAKKVSSKLEESIPRMITDAFEERMPEVQETLQTTVPSLISKPLNRELNALNILDTLRFENLQIKLLTAIRKKVHKSFRKCIWKEIDIVKDRLSYCGSMLDKGDVNIQDLVNLMKDMVSLLDSALFFRTTNAGEYLIQLRGTLVVHTPKAKDLEEKTSKEEPPSKRLKFLILNPITSSPNPLITILPQNITLEQFTNSLFQKTSSEYSPTPFRDDNKGKGISTEEELMKQIMPLIEQERSDPKMINLYQFNISGKKMTLEEAQAQLIEIKRLVDLKDKQEKTVRKLKKLNLIPLPGVKGTRGLVIKELESGIFFHNGLTECKALTSNLRRIQVKVIVKEVEDYLKTYSSAGMDISWLFALKPVPSTKLVKVVNSWQSCSLKYEWDVSKNGHALNTSYVLYRILDTSQLPPLRM